MAEQAIRIKIKSAEARVENVRLRIPFKFGIATLTDTPMLTMRVVVEDAAGKSATGHSCDVLPALWFDKAPGKTSEQKVEDQITMAQLAMEEYLQGGADLISVFDLWWAAYRALHQKAKVRGINPLTAGFGSSFAERATMDAACRLAGVSFFEAVKRNLFSIEAGIVHPELAGFDISSAIPSKPLSQIWCRHTVGLGDALRGAEVKAEDRLSDGLPQSLEDDIDTYGLRYFKIKIDADRERNLARLSAMAEIIAAKCPAGFKSTLDGNEQVKGLEDVAWLLRELNKSAAGKKLVDSIIFVEQPLARDVALSPEMEPAIREFIKLKPLIIDESDNDVNSLVEARAIGYGGISVKNCKGIFKAILNKCLIAKWNQPLILSSEDLTNIGVIALQEDLATLATLGIDHSERNGHHYFRGLSHLTPEEQEDALKIHPDLYEWKNGFVGLKIRDGLIQIGSIQRPGYGYSCEVDFERRPRIEEWRNKI